MKKYKVSYTSEFVLDFNDSFDWGIANWGERLALNWADQVEDRIAQVLSKSPKGCPIAPESEYLNDNEIRHLIIGRYRVLFTIEQDEVTVIHLRGPFNLDVE